MKMLWQKYSYVMILVVVTYAAVFILFREIEEPSEFISVTVEEGQSLWEIAINLSDHHTLSAEQFVAWVKTNNRINGDVIHPGDTLLVPVRNVYENDSQIIVLAGEGE